MDIDKCGFSVFDGSDLIQLMYQGHFDKITELLILKSSETEKFNQILFERESDNLKLYTESDLSDSEIQYIHKQLQQEWFIPEEYKNINLSDRLLEQCNTEEEKARVIDELSEFTRRDMLMLLRFMIYLVDFMKENNIVWGVGRGSSVASYVLYLIGIHRVDSIKYNLDFKEFMR